MGPNVVSPGHKIHVKRREAIRVWEVLRIRLKKKHHQPGNFGGEASKRGKASGSGREKRRRIGGEDTK